MKILTLFLFISLINSVFPQDWPKSRNTNALSPEQPSTIFLGDIAAFGCDSWATCNGNWPQWRVVIRYNNSAISDGVYGSYTDFSNVEHKTANSPRFTQTGTWYWGIQVNYGNNPVAWYCKNDPNWNNMWGSPTSDLTVTVNALNNPSAGSFTAGDNAVELNWSKDAQNHNVMIVRKTSAESFMEPTQGVAYSVGENIGSGVVIYNGSGTSFTDNSVVNGTSYGYKFYSENYSYYSSGTLADGVEPLPVELSSFSASIIKGNVFLTWSTVTEVNNYGFEIERYSASQWQKLGFVKGSGNSNSTKNYSYTDAAASSGNLKYRLKQIDTDGSYSYSNETEVLVNSVPDGFLAAQNYPNPFNPSTTIKFGFENSTEAVVTVFDQLGNKVQEIFKGNTDAGKIYNIEFNGTGLASGIYYYTITTPQESRTVKMLLMK